LKRGEPSRKKERLENRWNKEISAVREKQEIAAEGSGIDG